MRGFRDISLGAWTVMTAVAVGACSAGTLIVLTSSVDSLRRGAKAAAQAAGTTVVANRIEVSALEVEAAERGFVATGRPTFLIGFDGLARAPGSAVSALSDRLHADEQLQFRVLDATMNRFVWAWAVPQVALARADPAAARAREATGEGIRRLAAVRRQMRQIRSLEQAHRDSQVQKASADSNRTTGAAVVGFALVMVILFAYVLFLRGFVAAPIRRLLASMREVGEGGRRRRSTAGGIAEIGELQRGFNDMATSIDDQRGRAESARAELDARRVDLERALLRSASEQDRIERLFGLAELLVGETDLAAAAGVVVDRIAEAGAADVVALYAFGAQGATLPALVAAHGVERSRLPAMLVANAGTTGAALAQRRTIHRDTAGAGLANPALGAGVEFRHTLDVPLIHGRDALGVMSLGRISGPAFDADELELIGHMADQSALALSTLLSYAQALRLGSLNATLIESSRDGIRLVDLEGDILTQNTRMADLIVGASSGTPPTGTFWTQAAAIGPRTTDPGGFDAVTESLRSHPEAELLYEYEISSTGQVLSRLVAPVLDGTGSQLGRIVILRDVTAERQAQRSKDDFVASVTHELRTPLTSISGYLELLLDHETGELTDEQRHFLDVVNRNAARLLRLVNDLLFVGRLESGMLELEPAETDLAGVIADAVEAAKPAGEAQGVALELSVEPLPILDADRSRLAQLVDNLLSNAIKFTPSGGRVSVHATADGDTVTLLVSDTGVGVPDAEKGRLFERFFRTSTATTQAVPGTGLGLSIAKAIAEAHGGTIAVEDTPGGGTTLRVELPLVAAGTAVAA